MRVTAIIAAGGRGARFSAARPKQLLPVLGRTLLERSVTLFASHSAIDEVIVAIPPELVASPPGYLRAAGAVPVRIVAGGDRRQDSVANAFAAASPESDIIVVHDAARPFASADLITRTIDAAADSGAALAAIASRDTVKLVAGAFVSRTLPRESIYLAQTPQAFRRDVLRAALAAGGDATDEASLAERAGHAVRIVEGEPTNIKITTVEDLAIAEAIASTLPDADRGTRIADGGSMSLSGMDARFNPQSAVPDPQYANRNPESAMSVGTGYDLHRLVAGRPLVVGGVTVDAERGPLAHSDGDVACHAITDAILGAACLGDIGLHFPDTDAAWKGASSLDLLSRAVSLVRDEGYDVGNVDVTIVLQAPKIRPHIASMREAIATAIGIDAGRVSVKGKTNEGVDAVGRGDAIAAHAVALVRARAAVEA